MAKTYKFRIPEFTLRGIGKTEEEAWQDAQSEFLDDPGGDLIYDIAECVEGENEPGEPEEGDYVTEDHCHFYQERKLVLNLVPDLTTAEMWEELHRHMEEANFFPNVWFLSDHGNYHLMTEED